VQPATAAPFTTIHHTHSNEFVPLASPVESSENMTTYSARPSNIFHLSSHSTLEQTTRTSSPRADSTSGQHPGHPHASQAAASPTYLSRHLSAFASRMQVLDQQIELIVTASVGLVWSGQHLAHNAQRHNAPAHSTHYFAITIEEISNDVLPMVWDMLRPSLTVKLRLYKRRLNVV